MWLVYIEKFNKCNTVKLIVAFIIIRMFLKIIFAILYMVYSVNTQGIYISIIIIQNSCAYFEHSFFLNKGNVIYSISSFSLIP